MLRGRRPWREELEIIDRTMKAISGVTDPDELVSVYWSGIGELLPVGGYLAASRRDLEPPFYRITRSSRFAEEHQPWTQRERLPKFSGGLVGEIVYGNKPVFIDDLPSRVAADDPGKFDLDGFQTLIALPHYDVGESINVTMMLLPKGMEIDPAAIPMMHWQAGLFGRGTQNLVLKNQLDAAMKDLDRELQTVGEIQRSLLPSELLYRSHPALYEVTFTIRASSGSIFTMGTLHHRVPPPRRGPQGLPAVLLQLHAGAADRVRVRRSRRGLLRRDAEYGLGAVRRL